MIQSFSSSLGVFFWVGGICDDQETGVAGVFWAGWIGLVGSDETDEHDKSSGFCEGECLKS